MKTILTLAVATFLICLAANPILAKDSWTVRKELARGGEIDIQTMYHISRRTCVGQKVPPQPVFRKAPQLGKVAFWEGQTAPHQCPSTTINARFAKYRAGDVPGRDRFVIHWKSTENPKTVFRVTYIIDVK